MSTTRRRKAKEKRRYERWIRSRGAPPKDARKCAVEHWAARERSRKRMKLIQRRNNGGYCWDGAITALDDWEKEVSEMYKKYDFATM